LDVANPTKGDAMTSPDDLVEKLWKALKSDRTVMLALSGSEHGMAQPMTALLDKDADRGPIYIFTSKDTDLARVLGGRQPAMVYFADKGHDIFATIEGELVAESDAAVIDRLWNPYVAAWFEGGRDDPALQLLRFDPGAAQIWKNDNSLFAGIRVMLGRDPKDDYKDNVASVRLGH
jgi:general stress protein 26